MKFNELLKQPVTVLMENDILKDVVFSHDSVQSVIDRIKGKDPKAILVIYVNDLERRIQGVITDANVGVFLDNITALEKPLNELTVSELKWDLCKDFWIKKDTNVFDFLVKMSSESANTFIVVDRDDVYTGKIRRANALNKMASLIE